MQHCRSIVYTAVYCKYDFCNCLLTIVISFISLFPRSICQAKKKNKKQQQLNELSFKFMAFPLNFICDSFFVLFIFLRNINFYQLAIANTVATHLK